MRVKILLGLLLAGFSITLILAEERAVDQRVAPDDPPVEVEAAALAPAAFGFDPAALAGMMGMAGMQPADQFAMQDLNLDAIFGDLLGALGIRVGDRGTLQKEVRISFEEAAFGCTKQITYDRVEPCGDCAGSGSAPGASTERCSACAGRGRVRMQQGMFPIAIERPCGRCRGTSSSRTSRSTSGLL